jgi:ribosomal protein L32
MDQHGTVLADTCPKCGEYSYRGGYCFRCGVFRPSKHNAREEDLDAASFMDANFGQQMRIFLTEGRLSQAGGEDDEDWSSKDGPNE